MSSQARRILGLVLLLLCVVTRSQARREDPYIRALNLRDQARVLMKAGQRAEAIQKTEEALALVKSVRSADDPETQATELELGVMYMSGEAPQEQLDAAVRIFDKASEDHKTATRTAAERYLKALQQRLVARRLSGHSADALGDLMSILDWQRRIYPPGSLEVATTFAELATEHRLRGSYASAIFYLQNSLIITRKNIESLDRVVQTRRKQRARTGDDILHHQSLITLGSLQIALEQFAEAQTTLQEVLRYTQEHPVWAWVLVEPHALLGAASVGLGNRLEARSHFAKALEYAQQAPRFVDDPLAMAARYLDVGDYAKAEVLLRAEQSNQSKNQRNDSSIFSLLNYLLAITTAQQGKIPETKRHLEALLRSSESRINFHRFAMIEAELIPLFDYLRDRDEALTYTLFLDHLQDVGWQRLALTTVLLRKTRVLDELANASPRLALAGVDGPDPEIDALFQKLRRLRGRYAHFAEAGRADTARADGARNPDSDARLSTLAIEMEGVERELLRRSEVYARRQTPAVDDVVERVAASLPKDAVLVEYLAVRTNRWGAEGRMRSEARYLALGLRPDGSTAAWDLGPAKPIEDAATALVANASLSSPKAEEDRRQTQTLTEHILRPLQSFVRGQNTLIIAPDGILNQVPFAALYVREGVRLIEQHRLRYVNSGRDLLARRAPSRPLGAPVIFARPDFQAPIRRYSTRSGGRGSWPLAADIWTDLPGTGVEQAQLIELMPWARSYLGAEASEANLLNVTAPVVLHIATHGKYIAPDSEKTAVSLGSHTDLSNPAAGLGPTHPLLRSALILAGAGRLRAHDEGSESVAPELRDGHDGIVTALEASGMDLAGTQLVVLSTCESGRGDAVRGQGVLGLRRAFLLAGAESVVATLWRVDDQATAYFMARFYAELLRGADRSIALQRTMQRMLTTQGKHEAHRWAPFVLIGQDGPVQLSVK